MRYFLFALLVALPTCAFAAPESPANAARSADELNDRITKLITQLGDQEYVARARAQRELAQIGLEAVEALTAARNSSDVEVAAQAKFIVRQIRSNWTRASDPAELTLIIEDYDSGSLESRREKIKQIADLGERPRSALVSLEWLCRLARFEDSELLAKEAALKAMQQSIPTDKKEAGERYALIARTVARSRRPAAQWLKAYVLEPTNPSAAVDAWEKVIEAEEHVLDKQSETSPLLMSTLLRRQVGLLDQLKRPEDALKAIARLVKLERGDAESLVPLVDWLSERKAWQILDDVSERFEAAINADPVLLYTLANARRLQGNQQLAEETAKKAFALNQDKVTEHLKMAYYLQQHGLHDWSDREYRFVIDKFPLTDVTGLRARSILSENLHDRQREAEAAETLKPLVDLIDKGDIGIRQVLDSVERPAEGIKSRMLYFQAVDAQLKGNEKAHVELLEKAIEVDQTDADVLIGLYRIPNQDAAQRKRTKDLITKAVDQSKTVIDEFPEDPTAYNQLAWLVGNTEGNIDEAIAFSQKSVELRRAIGNDGVGGYLDTLAHCYYGKGDFANAVETQEEAARLEPHSQAIARQLKVFKEALAKQKEEKGTQ
jgi:tetratricopeptide (TPR) repeat protein